MASTWPSHASSGSRARRTGQVQTAYQILSRPTQGRPGDVWDSGEGRLGQVRQVHSAARRSRAARPTTGRSIVIEKAARARGASCRFDTGLYAKSDWTGAGSGRRTSSARSSRSRPGQAAGPTSPLGYTSCVERRKAGNHSSPGLATYDKRVLYVTYDVTSFRRGRQRRRGDLGHGWYKAGPALSQHRARGRFILSVVATPPKAADGPIFADTVYDGNPMKPRETPGWDRQD